MYVRAFDRVMLSLAAIERMEAELTELRACLNEAGVSDAAFAVSYTHLDVYKRQEMARTTQYFLLATRILAELGASAVKTYYCKDEIVERAKGEQLAGRAWFRGLCDVQETTCDMKSVDR